MLLSREFTFTSDIFCVVVKKKIIVLIVRFIYYLCHVSRS